MANFTEYDYDALVERITNNLKEKENWGDAYNSSTGQTLIQIIADASDQLAYMLERRSQENYITTAKLESSIFALANQLNYRPRRRVSASGTLKIRLVDDDGNTISPEGNIEIPRYTRIFYDDNTFVNTEDVLITPGDTEIEFSVIEGRPQSETFDPDDDFVNSSYILFEQGYTSIENTSIFITDESDNEWRDVRRSYDGEVPIEALSFVGQNERYYDVIISNDGLRIVFGNNTFGLFPSDPLIVEWVESSGSDLRIDSTGLTFTLEQNQLQDDINVTPANTYEYEIVNVTGITGGLDEEDVEDVRIKAPEYFKTGNRAVTAQDYDHIILNSGIGGIVDVNTYGEQEIGVTSFNMNNVYSSYLKESAESLTVEEEEELREYMDIFKVANVHLVLERVDEILTQMNLKFSKNPRLRVSNPELYEYVKNQIVDYFNFEEGSIEKPLYYSELVEFLQNLTITRDGVTQSVARYLTMDLYGLTPFSSPIEEQEIEVEISSGSTGDNYVITINGEDYEYEQQSGDDADSIAQSLSVAIADGDEPVDSEVSDNVITITSTQNETTFSISNDKSTEPSNVYIEQFIQTPPFLLNNQYNDDILLKGSVEIVDADTYDVLYQDDGNGNIGNGTVNYIDASVTMPILPVGNYYVRYKHDNFDNLYANERTVIGLLNPKTNFSDDDLLSTIDIEL